MPLRGGEAGVFFGVLRLESPFLTWISPCQVVHIWPSPPPTNQYP